MIKHTIINTPTLESEDMTVLHIIHNAGFFSCNTIALMDIIHYFNSNKGLPDKVDRSAQYNNYKSNPGVNLIPLFFKEDESITIPFEDNPIPLDYDCMSIQFAPYTTIPFDHWSPIVSKYFTPSQHVYDTSYNLGVAYNLDYHNLCGVFYRGNDKNREMAVAPYESFIEKSKEIKADNPDIKFLVQPDETEFLEAFQSAFPNDTICFTETPHMRKKDSAIFFEMPMAKRAEYAVKFFAALICQSRCKHVITHSGNLGLWTSLYRGNAENIHQIFNGQWL